MGIRCLTHDLAKATCPSQGEQVTVRSFLQAGVCSSLFTCVSAHTSSARALYGKGSHHPYFTEEEAESGEVEDPARVSRCSWGCADILAHGAFGSGSLEVLRMMCSGAHVECALESFAPLLSGSQSAFWRGAQAPSISKGVAPIGQGQACGESCRQQPLSAALAAVG